MKIFCVIFLLFTCGKLSDDFESIANGELLCAFIFALAAFDTGRGDFRGQIPVPGESVEYVLFIIIACESVLVVGVHHLWNVDIYGARQAVATAGAEVVE